MHGRDAAGTHFSPLTQITAANAHALREVCGADLPDDGPVQSDLAMVGGTLYLATAHLTVALDATTCAIRWTHRWSDGPATVGNRGVAVGDGRVYRATASGWLIALTASTGRLAWSRSMADGELGEVFTMAPVYYDGLVFIGPAGSDNPARGWITAVRASDGALVWRTPLVPPDGPGWGGGVWTPPAIDTMRGWLYVPVANPAPAFAPDARPPDSLTNAVAVLDLRTGRRLATRQLVPNDRHDWDLTQVSPLFRTGPADRLATAGKDGVLRVLDRVTLATVYAVPITTLSADSGAHVCPGITGGVLWNGPAYSPASAMLYVQAVDWCATITPAPTVRRVSGELYLGGTYQQDTTQRGWLTAVDAANGTVRWRYASPRPMIAAVLATAGGLVVTGELTGDLLALDARSGAVIWRHPIGAPMGAGVIAYGVHGRQYLAVLTGTPSALWLSTSAPQPPAVHLFALP